MLQALRCLFERSKEVIEHSQVGFHLISFLPALHQAGLFIQRSIDDMSDIMHLTEDLYTLGLVLQVDRNDCGTLQAIRDSTRNTDNLPVFLLGKVLYCSVANE